MSFPAMPTVECLRVDAIDLAHGFGQTTNFYTCDYKNSCGNGKNVIVRHADSAPCLDDRSSFALSDSVRRESAYVNYERGLNVYQI